MTKPAPQIDSGSGRGGVAFAAAAYGLWGLFPIYFYLLKPAGALEIVLIRIILTFVFCVLVIAATRAWGSVKVILKSRRTALTLGVGSVLITVNWTLYVIATISGHVVEAALGYFITPLLTVLLGIIVNRERLRPAQWVALAIGTVAIVVIAVGYGVFPWLALGIAASFGLYGLVKNKVGARVDAVTGLAFESGWVLVPTVVVLIVLASGDGLVTGTVSVSHTVLILASGVVTGIPLLLFAGAARRLPLSVLGLTQYITPVLQFLVGVLLFNEAMPPERWLGFALVWVALVIFTIDMVRTARAASAGRRSSPPPLA